jgi:hypothetical protein
VPTFAKAQERVGHPEQSLDAKTWPFPPKCPFLFVSKVVKRPLIKIWPRTSSGGGPGQGVAFKQVP